MKKLCLLGPVDKREISYPLIKSLMLMGKTLVVTDDGVYRRFDEEYKTEFDFAHSRFIVIPKLDDAVESKVKSMEHEFEYILYITTNELPKEYDNIVYVRGVEKGICSKDILDILENLEYAEVLVTFDKKVATKAIKFTPSLKGISYVFECEEKKEFLGFKDMPFSSVLFAFFEKELGISKKTLSGLMGRKE